MKPTPEDGFYYVTVGGAPVEIVRVHKGLMYSTGCADGHPLDGVELIERIDYFPKSQAEKTKQEKKLDAEWEANKTRRVKEGLPAYGYRTFE